MLNVLKLGYAEFEVRDVERMAEFYSNVVGLTETGRDGKTVYLSTSIDHHSIVLRGGASKTRLSKLAFQVAPVANGDLTKHFKDNGLYAEVRTGSQPAINQIVRTLQPGARRLARRPRDGGSSKAGVRARDEAFRRRESEKHRPRPDRALFSAPCSRTWAL